MENYQTPSRVVSPARKTLAEKNQLQFGELIAEEIDARHASTADLIELAERIGCSLRTARYAVDVYRLAKRVGLSEGDVEKTGWTKSAVVAAARGETATKEELVALCEGRTVTELRGLLAGTAGAIRSVVFTLNKTQRATLEAALIRFGARQSGRSISDKEEALMRIVGKVA